MVEGHWGYVAPWDDEEAEWRCVLFAIAPLSPRPEPPETAAGPPPPGMPILHKVEAWIVGEHGLAVYPVEEDQPE